MSQPEDPIDDLMDDSQHTMLRLALANKYPARPAIIKEIALAGCTAIQTLTKERGDISADELISGYFMMFRAGFLSAYEQGADPDVLKAACRSVWLDLGGTNKDLAPN